MFTYEYILRKLLDNFSLDYELIAREYLIKEKVKISKRIYKLFKNNEEFNQIIRTRKLIFKQVR